LEVREECERDMMALVLPLPPPFSSSALKRLFLAFERETQDVCFLSVALEAMVVLVPPGFPPPSINCF